MNTSPATPTPPAGQLIQGESPPAMFAPYKTPHGSVGAVFGVVAAIVLLGIIAGVIGRICGRRSVMGYGGRYDIEGWAETKCSSCIDGHVDPRPPAPAPAPENGGGEIEDGHHQNQQQMHPQ